jgi:hypothetical protein
LPHASYPAQDQGRNGAALCWQVSAPAIRSVVACLASSTMITTVDSSHRVQHAYYIRAVQ